MTTSSPALSSLPVVAEICLYGTSAIGAGYLHVHRGSVRPEGSHEPKQGRSFTEAVWLACDELRAAGVTSGAVRVFAPGGEHVAVIDIGSHVPTYGDMKFETV